MSWPEMPKRREREKEPTPQFYQNTTCPICGEQMRSGVHCKKEAAVICMSHCVGCQYHQSEFWHCRFLIGTAREEKHETVFDRFLPLARQKEIDSQRGGCRH